MTEYEEYKQKKPRNFTAIVLGAFLAILIIGLMISYALLVSGSPEETSAISYPEKISLPASEAHSVISPLEEGLTSDSFIAVEEEIDALENMVLDSLEQQATQEIDLAAITSPETTPIPPAPKENYNPVFVAAPNDPQWMTNAITTRVDPTKPMVAIVIDDLGIDKHRTQETIDLPAPITMAFLPYPTQLKEQTDAAKKAGHELIVHIPMEPSDLAHNNPGPKALLTSNSKAINLENLKSNLDQFDGYVGANNHMGSRFTSNYDAMGPVLEELKRRGLLFLDSRTIGSSKGKKLSNELGLPFVSRDVFLDHDPSRASVDASLAKTAAVALKKGTAIAIGHPKDNTIAALKAWIPQAQAQGIQIVSLTTIAHKRMNDDVLPVIADNAPQAKETAPEEKTSNTVTVTVGGQDTYDAIIWNESEETIY